MRTRAKAPFAFRVVWSGNGNVAYVYRRKADSAGRDRLQRIASINSLAFTAGASLLREAVDKSVIAGKSAHSVRRAACNSRASNHSDGEASNLQVCSENSDSASLKPGPMYPMDSDWGCRVACYALITRGLRNAEGMSKAASRLKEFDGNYAAWWLGMIQNDDTRRVIRALRILTEAVE